MERLIEQRLDRDGAAVRAAKPALLLEGLEIAPDRGDGDAELRGDLFD